MMLTVRFAVMLRALVKETVQFALYWTVPPLATAVEREDSEQEETVVTVPDQRGEDPDASGMVASDADAAERSTHHATTFGAPKGRRQARHGPCKRLRPDGGIADFPKTRFGEIPRGVPPRLPRVDP
ncbi:MAG TPA: hypothetical protein VGV64_07550 [Thermoplasmata archaeon]|nr:hypothetical protein [Thermoplasmata archaeon]